MDPINMDSRLSYQDAMELIEIPDEHKRPLHDAADIGPKRFMATRPGWVPGMDLPWERMGLDPKLAHKAAYGGFVFSLSGQAALRTLERATGREEQLGLHSIQGCFTTMGLADRPFVLDVNELYTGRSFATRLVTVRQPTVACVLTETGRFSLDDAKRHLGRICFTGLVSFKTPARAVADAQETPPMKVHAQLLEHRAPWAWASCPSVDMDRFTSMFADCGPGTFPVIDMRKVDMTAFNHDKPLTERREVILYRLLQPLSEDEPNHHGLVHAFAADRNGLLMLGSNLDCHLEMAATLSFSIFVHVNPKQTIMKFDPAGKSGWWLLEASFPRADAGRGAVMSKIWSPEGLHVATGYQDGNIRAMPSSTNGKL